MKICSECNFFKSLAEYYKSARHKDGHYSKCKVCCRKKGRKRYHSNPGHYKKIQERYMKRRPQSRRNTLLKHNFGITADFFDKIFKKQNGLCAICRLPETVRHQKGKVKSLSVDHDHNTGKVRGLLCGKCNHAIGLFMDNPDNLINASRYLRKFR